MGFWVESKAQGLEDRGFGFRGLGFRGYASGLCIFWPRMSFLLKVMVKLLYKAANVSACLGRWVVTVIGAL